MGGLVGAISCGLDGYESVQSRSSPFSESACATAARNAFEFPTPNFSITSPSSYNTCGKGYVVDVGTGGQMGKTGGSGGATYHHDVVVSYAGNLATDQSTCEGLYADAYFYKKSASGAFLSLGEWTSSGVWLPQRAACVPPALDLRDFDQYLLPSVGDMVRVAATVRDPAQNTLPLTVAGIQFGIDTPTGCSADASYMLGEQGLFADQFMYSCDGRFRLYMQDDGNLVLSQKDASGNFSIALWTTQTNGIPAANLLEMQDDGDLVIYSFGGARVWSSGTSGKPGLHLKLYNNGNMKLYDGSYGTVWQTNTGGH